MSTEVVFRAWKNGDVIALFPNEDFCGRGTCMSYEHVGQHGEADYFSVVSDTKPASPSEFAPLKTELESIGYELRVFKRRPRRGA